MSRRFNFTGRVKIRKEDVAVSLASDGSSVCQVHLRLADYQIKADAEVIVEAARGRLLRVRGIWGRAGIAMTPEGAASSLDISLLEDLEGVRFRILVVERDTYRLLASAEDIALDFDVNGQQSQRSLLPIIMRDLEGGVWEIDDITSNPTLVLDVNLGSKQQIKSSSVLAAILPGVIRTILVAIAHEHQSQDDESDFESVGTWLQLGEQWAGYPPPHESDHTKIDEWAQSAVTSFCRDKKIRYQLANHIRSEE